jgi:integrase
VLTTLTSDCADASLDFFLNGGFVDLGPEADIDLDSDCDNVPSATPSPKQAGRQPVPKRRGQNPRMYKTKPVWALPYYDYAMTGPNGKPSRRTAILGRVESMSIREAEKTRLKFLASVNATAETPTPKSGMKLKDFTPEWLEQVAVHQSDSSRRAVNSHLRAHITPRLGDLALTDINTRTVQTFVTALSTDERGRKTIDNILLTLWSILDKAKAFGYACGQISKKDLALPRRSIRRQTRSLDAGEMGSTIRHAKEPYATMLAVLTTALRSSEMRGLKTTDLDFEKRVIHVRRSVDARTRREQPTKSPASRADVPMPDQLKNRLKRFLQQHWRDNPEGFLFVNQNGKPYSHAKFIEYGLWSAQDAAGVRRSGTHAFRHGVSSELLERGAAPSVAQKQLRHSSAVTTLQHYSHPIGDAQRTAVEALASRIERHASEGQLESSR